MMHKLESLQCLRAFAVIAVIIFHARLNVQKFLSESFGESLIVGAAGVDLFFVISGFIMWVITDQRPTSPRRFIARRITRIVPLYWIISFVYIGLCVLQDHFAVLGGSDNSFSISHIWQSLLFIPHMGPHGVYPVLIPGWTLNYEMFFYAIFALSLFFAVRLRLGMVCCALVLCVLIGLTFDSDNTVIAFFTDSILLEFLMGIGIAYLWRRNALPKGKLALLLFMTGCFCILCSMFFVDLAISKRALFWGLPSAMIVSGALHMPILQSGRTLLVKIGDSSYSTYLAHNMGLSFLSSVWLFLPAIFQTHVGAAFYVIVGIIGSCVGGYIVYYLIETPSEKFFRNLLDLKVEKRGVFKD